MTSDAMIETAQDKAEPAAASARVRPFYWSVRRELWENPAIWRAPLIVAAVILVGVLIGTAHPPNITFSGHGHRAEPMQIPPIAHYLIAAGAILICAFIVAVFYCLGALHNERVQRTVLFWKSLPVSDRTSVLAKAAIPMLVLPLVAFAVALATHLVMLLIGTVAAMVKGDNPEVVWAQASLARTWLYLLYSLVVLIPWYAPIWGWLLMVSAWARRATFLWGVGPWLALCVAEQFAFSTSNVWSMLAYRLGGAFTEAFGDFPRNPDHRVIDLPPMDPLRYLAAPGLWVGLAAAAAFIAAAIWLRRRKEPI
jgi:ABC-2 type transport system permease protein